MWHTGNTKTRRRVENTVPNKSYKHGIYMTQKSSRYTTKQWPDCARVKSSHSRNKPVPYTRRRQKPGEAFGTQRKTTQAAGQKLLARRDFTQSHINSVSEAGLQEFKWNNSEDTSTLIWSISVIN